MRGYPDPEGIALFNTWAPRVLWTWFPTLPLLAVLIGGEWAIFGLFAWVWLIVHTSVLLIVHWRVVGDRAGPIWDWVWQAAIALLGRVRSGPANYPNTFVQAAHEQKRDSTFQELATLDKLAGDPSDEAALARMRITDAMEARYREYRERDLKGGDKALSPAEIEELRGLRLWMEREGPPVAPLAAPAAVQGFGAFAAAPASTGILSAILGQWQAWVMGLLLVFGLGGWGANAVTGARLDNAKNDLTETRLERDAAQQERDQWRENYETAHREFIAAQEQAAQTSRTIEQERARSRAAAAAERRRQSEIRDVLIDGPAPTWGLPDATFQPPGPGGAASDLPGSGDPR